jgi:hypothetical protein
VAALGLSKADIFSLGEAFEILAEGIGPKHGGDPVLACRGAPMLQCDMVQRLVAASLKRGVGGQDAALALCRAFDELCGLNLEGGWIREESSHWADRDPAAHALYNDMPKLALYLVDRGASVDAQLHDGEPMLVWFARCSGELLDEFMERGPDLNARGRSGGTFLHQMSWLEKFGDEQPMGVYRRAVAKAKSRGLDLNVRDHDGRAPLHWAAQMGDVCLAQALVEAGADPLALSAAGSAPWEEGGSNEVVEYLESAALAAREARELFGLWGDKSRAAGEAVLALIAMGRLSIDGVPIENVGELLKAAGERGKSGKTGSALRRL